MTDSHVPSFERDVIQSLSRIETKIDDHKETLDDHETRLRRHTEQISNVENAASVNATKIGTIGVIGGAVGTSFIEWVWHKLFR